MSYISYIEQQQNESNPNANNSRDSNPCYFDDVLLKTLFNDYAQLFQVDKVFTVQDELYQTIEACLTKIFIKPKFIENYITWLLEQCQLSCDMYTSFKQQLFVKVVSLTFRRNILFIFENKLPELSAEKFQHKEMLPIQKTFDRTKPVFMQVQSMAVQATHPIMRLAIANLLHSVCNESSQTMCVAVVSFIKEEARAARAKNCQRPEDLLAQLVTLLDLPPVRCILLEDDLLTSFDKDLLEDPKCNRNLSFQLVLLQIYRLLLAPAEGAEIHCVLENLDDSQKDSTGPVKGHVVRHATLITVLRFLKKILTLVRSEQMQFGQYALFLNVYSEVMLNLIRTYYGRYIWLTGSYSTVIQNCEVILNPFEFLDIFNLAEVSCNREQHLVANAIKNVNQIYEELQAQANDKDWAVYLLRRFVLSQNIQSFDAHFEQVVVCQREQLKQLSGYDHTGVLAQVEETHSCLLRYGEVMNNVEIKQLANLVLTPPDELTLEDAEATCFRYFEWKNTNRAEDLRLNNNQHFLNVQLRRYDLEHLWDMRWYAFDHLSLKQILRATDRELIHHSLDFFSQLETHKDMYQTGELRDLELKRHIMLKTWNQDVISLVQNEDSVQNISQTPSLGKQEVFDCMHFNSVAMSMIDQSKLKCVKAMKKTAEEQNRFCNTTSGYPSGRAQSVHVDTFQRQGNGHHVLQDANNRPQINMGQVLMGDSHAYQELDKNLNLLKQVVSNVTKDTKDDISEISNDDDNNPNNN